MQEITAAMTVRDALPLLSPAEQISLQFWAKEFGIPLREFHLGHIRTYESQRLREGESLYVVNAEVSVLLRVHGAAGPSRGAKPVDVFPVCLSKPTWDEAVEGFSYGLGCATAEHVLCGGIEQDYALLFVHRDDRIHRRINDCRQIMGFNPTRSFLSTHTGSRLAIVSHAASLFLSAGRSLRLVAQVMLNPSGENSNFAFLTKTSRAKNAVMPFADARMCSPPIHS